MMLVMLNHMKGTIVMPVHSLFSSSFCDLEQVEEEDLRGNRLTWVHLEMAVKQSSSSSGIVTHDGSIKLGDDASGLSLQYSFYSMPQCSHCKHCTSYGSSVHLSHAGVVSK